MLRIGMLGVAHVHTPGYARCLKDRFDAKLVGILDHDAKRCIEFSDTWGVDIFDEVSAILAKCDAVIVCSENTKHAEYIELAARTGRPILCEKPLSSNKDQAKKIKNALDESGTTLMTAFPCPFSPTFQRLQERVKNGEIGKILAINATNRGRCPGGWFTEKELSGGGAMIDHVVHVADLLRRLLGEEPTNVTAQIGSNMYGKDWDDTAHLTIDFASGVFATLDSSWSRPQNYKTWGDVTLKVTGEKGVIEVDLFGQGLTVLTEKYRIAGTGSDLDSMMVGEFIAAVNEKRAPRVTAHDGLMASAVAIAGYESATRRAAIQVA